ncbi:MAG: hypothetical protein ACRDD1_13910, partial [Planctomycetia bacterium]
VGSVPADLTLPEGATTAARTVVYKPAVNPSNWTNAADQMVSLHFQGVGVREAAVFFHHATGLSVRLDAPAATDAVYVRCRNLTVRQALPIVLGSCGLGYMVEGGVLRIAEPGVIQNAVDAAGPTVEAYWIP